MTDDLKRCTLRPIGVVRSPLAALDAAPLQGDEGAPEAWLEIAAPMAQGLAGIKPVLRTVNQR